MRVEPQQLKAFLLDAEQASREYHTLPYGGGLWDQPLALLVAFTSIRYERNQFERIRIDKMKKSSNKGGSQTPGLKQVTQSPNEDLPPRKRNIDD